VPFKIYFSHFSPKTSGGQPYTTVAAKCRRHAPRTSQSCPDQGASAIFVLLVGRRRGFGEVVGSPFSLAFFERRGGATATAPALLAVF